ncbi:MAG: hypothetical protein K8R74_18375 [Bacteroidales bacterium]|nr:hypothetical protein [Bacteroidales bacterium]
MLTIRKEQLQFFEDLSFQSFLDEMVDHIKDFTPKLFETIGKENIRQIIKLGITRAKKYDLTYHSTVKFYLELMFMFGCDFDSDPQYPWIKEILEEGADWNQEERGDEIYEKVMDYYESVIGPNCEYEIKALQNVIQIPFTEFKELSTERPEKILNRIEIIYPQKCNYLGESSLKKLLDQAIFCASNHRIDNNAGRAISFALMFSLGHGCFNDLQFPWISITVNKSLHLNPGEKTQKLYSRMMTFYQKTLNSLKADQIDA